MFDGLGGIWSNVQWRLQYWSAAFVETGKSSFIMKDGFIGILRPKSGVDSQPKGKLKYLWSHV